MQQIELSRVQGRFFLSTSIVVLFVLVLIPRLSEDAHAASNAEPAMTLERTVNVPELATPGTGTMAATVLPRRVPNEASFLALKQSLAAQTRALEGGLSALGPETSSAVSAQSGFAGMNFLETGLGLFGFVPPDTVIAAGPSDLMEVANSAAAVYDKSGRFLALVSLYDFFGASLFSQIVSDPRVLYDAQSGRWFLSVVIASSSLTSGGWRLAVSTTNDPGGAYYLYAVNTSGSFPDFPKLGMSDDKVVLTGDAFTGSSSFLGTEYLVARKAQLLAGASRVAIKFFKPNQGMFAIEPAQTLHTGSDGALNTEYMAADNGALATNGVATTIRVWKITGVPGVGTGVTVARANLALNPTIQFPPNAEQPGTTDLVDTNDNSLLDAVWRSGNLWVGANSGCTPTGDSAVRSCLRLIEVSTSGTPAIKQNFDHGDAGTYYYYPAVRTDSVGDLVAVFSGSSATSGSLLPSVLASQQLTSDSKNTLETPIIVHQGDTPYTQSARWGDYSGAGVDPSDDTTVWIGGEYATNLAGSAWGTWITSVVP
jgi:hypothetical protein